MKRLLLFLLLLTSCATVPVYKTVQSIPVGVAFSTAYIDLNTGESGRVLRKLDSYCGETWCLGGWIYHFERGGQINCKYSEGICLLSAKVYTDAVRTTFRSCKIVGPKRFRDLMNGNALNERFHQQVVECIELWEDSGFRATN